MKRWCQLSSVVAMGRGKSLRESAAYSFVNGWVGHPAGCVVDGGMTKGGDGRIYRLRGLRVTLVSRVTMPLERETVSVRL